MHQLAGIQMQQYETLHHAAKSPQSLTQACGKCKHPHKKQTPLYIMLARQKDSAALA